ncbi:hypothetical protein IAT38_005633 [Cryptococcus sp. DSM 104549]
MPTPPINNPSPRTSTPSPSRGKPPAQRLPPSLLGVSAAPTVATAFDIDLSGLPHVASPLSTSTSSQHGESSSSVLGASLAASSTLSQFITTAKHSHASSRPRRSSTKDRPSSPASISTTLSSPPDDPAHASSASPESSRRQKRQRHPSIVHRTSGRGGIVFHPPAARSSAEASTLEVHQVQPTLQGQSPALDEVVSVGEASGRDEVPGRSSPTSTTANALPDGAGDLLPARESRSRHGSLIPSDPKSDVDLADDEEGEGEQELNEVGENKAIQPTSPDKVISPAEGAEEEPPSSEADIPAVTHEQSEEPALHEVDSSPPTDPSPNAHPHLEFSPPFKSPSPKDTAPLVPYTPRLGSSPHSLPAPPTDKPTTPDEDFTLSLYLSLSRPHPLPQQTSYRFELCLAWAGQLQPHGLRSYIPGGKYIPEWDVKVVGGGEAGRERVLDPRKVVRGVVAGLPVVWRLAGWI